MSFFSKVLKGIAIGVAVFVTGGAILGATGILGAAGITTLTGGALLQAAAIQGAIYGALQGLSSALIKPPKISMGDVRARSNVSVDTQAYGKWVFGRTSLGTDLVFSENLRNAQDEFDIIFNIVAGAAHEIDGYEEFYINDELITLDNGTSTGDWDGAVTLFRNLGNPGQLAFDIERSVWPATAKGEGIAHYGIAFHFTSRIGKDKFSSGIPTRLTQVARGCKVYDPRLDSTNGGVGLHRVDNQTTWAWTENWALLVAHYLLGYYQNSKLVYGVGCDADDIDWVQTSAMANVCDEIIDGKPKYRIGGLMSITQNHETVIGELESSVGGKVSKFGGRYYIWCPHDDLIPAGVLTDNDIVSDSGVSFSPSASIETLYNSARGQFVSPELLYQPANYSEIEEAAAITEDGKKRTTEVDFAFIQDQSIAERVAREKVRRSRFTATIVIATGPAGLLVKPFDVINVNIKETNYTNELFRVMSLQYSATGVVIIELLEEDASIYDTSTPLGPSLVQYDSETYDPARTYDVVNLDVAESFVNNVGGGVLDAILITWDIPSPFVQYTEIGYRINFGGEWIYDRASAVDRALIAPTLTDSTYEIRVRHWSIEGIAGPFAVIFHVTGNAEFDRISLQGIDDPVDPKLFITLNQETGVSNAKVSVGYSRDEFSVVPDRFLIFYSTAEAPNRLKVRDDAGSKLYLSREIGDGISGFFELTVGAGSTTTQVSYNGEAYIDGDTSNHWWASVRNAPGAPAPHYKVIEASETTLFFPPGVVLDFVPVQGQIIDIAELDFVDGRSLEFTFVYGEGEVIDHNGIKFDGDYYLDVISRGTEGTTSINQTGNAIDYYPAPGPQTDIIEIREADFTAISETEYFFSGQLTVNIPVSVAWGAVTCCFVREVTLEGRQIYIRSNIVPLTIAGSA